jgi:hypothetical protein
MKFYPPVLPLELERELFAAALDFRRAEPWRLLANTHFLFVAEPTGGRRVLTVLGNAGMQYGLQSYGASCAAQFLMLCEEMPRMQLLSPTILYELLEGVDVEFTAKGELDTHDHARAGRCDYRPVPRARQAWLRFRAWRPNRFPWHVDEGHVRRLLGDLRRALRWAELAPTLRWTDLDQPVALRRLPVVAESLPTDRPWTAADLTWERLVLPPAPVVPQLSVDLTRLADWRSRPLDARYQVVVDERAPMIRIADEAGGAPYFPRMGLCLDGQNGMILGNSMGRPDDAFGLAAVSALDAAIRARGSRPGAVHFANPSFALALGAVLRGADIKLAPGQVPPQALNEVWSMIT